MTKGPQRRFINARTDENGLEEKLKTVAIEKRRRATRAVDAGLGRLRGGYEFGGQLSCSYGFGPCEQGPNFGLCALPVAGPAGRAG
jgi:hypothetical protein